MKPDSTDSHSGPHCSLLLGLNGEEFVLLSSRALTRGFCSIPGPWEKPRGTSEASHILYRCSRLQARPCVPFRPCVGCPVLPAP